MCHFSVLVCKEMTSFTRKRFATALSLFSTPQILQCGGPQSCLSLLDGPRHRLQRLLQPGFFLPTLRGGSTMHFWGGGPHFLGATLGTGLRGGVRPGSDRPPVGPHFLVGQKFRWSLDKGVIILFIQPVILAGCILFCRLLCTRFAASFLPSHAAP